MDCVLGEEEDHWEDEEGEEAENHEAEEGT